MNRATRMNSTEARTPGLRSFTLFASCTAALMLAACSSGPSEETPRQSNPSSAESGASSNTPTSQGPDTHEPESTTDAAATSGSTPRCTVDDLTTTVEQGDSSAGHLNYTITFENTSDQTCQLDGHPGVSAVGDDDGTQIGDSATREGSSAKAVTLIPNAHATAELQAVNIGDGGGRLGDSCEVTEADGWRIYPPDSTDSVYVEQEGLEACASSDADWLSVSVVQPVS